MRRKQRVNCILPVPINVGIPIGLALFIFSVHGSGTLCSRYLFCFMFPLNIVFLVAFVCICFKHDTFVAGLYNVPYAGLCLNNARLQSMTQEQCTNINKGWRGVLKTLVGTQHSPYFCLGTLIPLAEWPTDYWLWCAELQMENKQLDISEFTVWSVTCPLWAYERLGLLQASSNL